MVCNKCQQILPTWKMGKEIQCKECGAKFSVQHFKIACFFSIFAIGPVFKLFVFSLLANLFGELGGFLITILLASLAICLLFKLIVTYQLNPESPR